MAKKNLTFAQEARLEYVRDIFTVPMVVCCLIYFLQILFWGAETYFVDVLSAEWYYPYLKQFVFFLFPALAVFLPLLFYNGAADGWNTSFRFGRVKVFPGYYLGGAFAVCGISVPLWYLSMLVVAKLESSGFVFTARRPFFSVPEGATVPVTVLYVLLAAVVPAFFLAASVHGYFLKNTKKASFTASVILSSLLFSLPHLSISTIPFTFAAGLILGWLYLKSGSVAVTMVVQAVTNTAVALLWLVSQREPERFASVMPFVCVVCALAGVCALLALFKKYGFRLVHEEKKEVLTRKEALYAVFRNFGFYLFIGITVFVMLFYYIEKPEADDSPETETTQPTDINIYPTFDILE